MSFTIVDRQPGGGSGEISIGQTGKCVELWTLVADDPDHSIEDVRKANLFPEVYTTFHSQNPRLRLMPLEIEQNSEAPQLFTVTVTWSSDKLDPQKKDEKEDSPLDRRARIKVKTGRMTETTHRDKRGVPKTNAAGDLFDPPIPSNVSYKIVTIRKNVTVFPDWVFDFDDAVNSLPFQIKSRTIAKHCAYIADIELGEENTDGPVPYCEATIEIWIKKKRAATAEETARMAANPSLGDVVPGPWWTEQLNEGFYSKGPGGVRQRIKIKDQDSSAMVPASSPVPLNALGGVLNPVTLDNIVYLEFHDHFQMDFNLISYLWSNA